MKSKFNLNQNAQSILVFRKWRRKNYSLFLMLKKTVKISVLAVTYHVSASNGAIAVTQDTAEVRMHHDLDEIEIGAQRSPVLYSQVARIISVIERQEIESSPAQSINELLEYVAGVDVRQRGAEGVQADVSIRGGTFDQTMILLNGINITDPQTGHHNFNLPVSINQVERIEVLEGPAARVYGPNAFSGAINIVTRTGNDNSLEMMAGTGSYGYFSSNLSGTFQTEYFQHMLALNLKKSDGYIENTDFENRNLFYSGLLEAEEGKFMVQAGYSQKGFGANSFYTPRFPNQYEATKTFLGSVKWTSTAPLHLSPVVYWRRHQDRFELFRSDPASWYNNHNYHLTNVYGTGLNSWVQWPLGKTAFGVEFRSENILSNVLGESLDSPRDVPGEDAEFTKSDQRKTISLFLEHAFYLDNWSLTAGAMGNRISGSGQGLNIFPGLDLSYNIERHVKFYTSFNTSLRMPTFTDLYYSGPTNKGNPDLDPEKSTAVEGGLKWRSAFMEGHAVVFYRKGKDIIDWVKTGSETIWQPKNLTRLNSLGTEINVTMKPKAKWEGSWPDRIMFSWYTNSLQKKKETGLISNYVLDNLKYKVSFSIYQTVADKWSLVVKAAVQDREGTYSEFVNNEYGSEKEYEPFLLVDAKVNYIWSKMNLYISASNLLDKSYFDIGNVVQPGRWIKAGVTYKIDFNN